jgi:hypothetical protein
MVKEYGPMVAQNQQLSVTQLLFDAASGVILFCVHQMEMNLLIIRPVQTRRA